MFLIASISKELGTFHVGEYYHGDETTSSRCVGCPCHHCITWNKRTCCRAENSTLCTAYGILMNTRWKELTLIQKVNGILLGFGNATERVNYTFNK